jgi:hypothetical protein
MKKRSPEEVSKLLGRQGIILGPDEVSHNLLKIAKKLRRLYPGLPEDDEKLLDFVSRFLK